jgi:hypothetical protein
MTLSEADVLLAQWAMWAFGGIQTGYAIGSWQKDWRTMDWDDGEKDWIEKASESLPPGDPVEMQKVDRALSNMGGKASHEVHVIRARYRFGHHPKREMLKAAIEMFILSFEALTSQKEQFRFTPVERIRSP